MVEHENLTVIIIPTLCLNARYLGLFMLSNKRGDYVESIRKAQKCVMELPNLVCKTRKLINCNIATYTKA